MDKFYLQFVGFRIEESGWVASDILNPEGARQIGCMEKVAEALMSGKICNINVTKTEEEKIHLLIEDIVPVFGKEVIDDLEACGLFR